MKTSLKHIGILLVFGFFATSAAFWIGKNENINEKQPLVISLSLMSGLVDIPVELIVKDGKKTQRNVITLPYTANNTLLYEFDGVSKIDSLNFRIHHNREVHITHLGVDQYDFSASYSVEEIIKNVHFYGCEPIINENGILVLLPEEGNLKFGFYFKKPIEIKPLSFNKPLEEDTFLYVFLFFVGVYLIRKLSPARIFGAIIPALLISFIGFGLLTLLKENVTNVNLKVKGSTLKATTEVIDIYYSDNGIYKKDKVLSVSASKLKSNDIVVDFPDNVNRYIRVDLPKNDSLIIESMQFDGWFFEEEIKGKEMPIYFPSTNDLGVVYRKDSIPVYLTGSDDPFILLSNPHFQSKIAFHQIKKRDYPIWMTIILFCVLMLVFSSKMNKKSLVFSSLFVLIITIPSVSFVVKEDNISLESEKRFAAKKPEKWKSVRDLKEQTDSYLQDQFGGRQKIITGWNILKIISYNQTSGSSAVKFGKNNWMFYTAEGLIPWYENKNPISEDSLRLICNVLEERRDWLELYGIDYYITIPPTKHTMYSEYLPSRIRQRSKDSKQDQVINYLKKHSTIKVIDLRPTLFEAKRKETSPIYYNCDSHWNRLGAWYAYGTIINRIYKDHPEIGKAKVYSDFNWSKTTSNEGDLAKLISLDEYFLRPEINCDLKSGFKAKVGGLILKDFFEPIKEGMVMETKDTTRLNLLVNRDSYSNFLAPLISEHFNRSTYIWTPLFCPKIIKDEMPDIVLTEIVERYIIDLAIENPPIVKQELERAKRQKMMK